MRAEAARRRAASLQKHAINYPGIAASTIPRCISDKWLLSSINPPLPPPSPDQRLVELVRREVRVSGGWLAASKNPRLSHSTIPGEVAHHRNLDRRGRGGGVFPSTHVPLSRVGRETSSSRDVTAKTRDKNVERRRRERKKRERGKTWSARVLARHYPREPTRMAPFTLVRRH